MSDRERLEQISKLHINFRYTDKEDIAFLAEQILELRHRFSQDIKCADDTFYDYDTNSCK